MGQPGPMRPYRADILEAAMEIERLRRGVTKNGEVRGASPLAGEASSAEGATSTVVLGAERPGKD